MDMTGLVRSDGSHGKRDNCAHCGRPIVDVTEVGWIDENQPGTYDMCADDTAAKHEPAPPPRPGSQASDVS